MEATTVLEKGKDTFENLVIAIETNPVTTVEITAVLEEITNNMQVFTALLQGNSCNSTQDSQANENQANANGDYVIKSSPKRNSQAYALIQSK